MGAAVLLRSDDCFQCSIHHERNPNPNPNSRKKRSPQDRDRSRCGVDQSCSVVKHPGVNLVMGQVKILKRGEKLSPEHNTVKKSEEEGFDLVIGSTDRIGPDPTMMQKQIRVPDLMEGMYAGQTPVASPPPSSVPVPVFLRRKNSIGALDLSRMLSLFS